MNLKDSAYKIKTQLKALECLLKGMESVDWTDETPIGVEIFLQHISKEAAALFDAIPGRVSWDKSGARQGKP